MAPCLLFPLILLLLITQVESQPTFGARAYNTSVVEGESVILSCRVFKRGSHTVAWKGPHGKLISLLTVMQVLDNRFSVKNKHPDEWNLEIDDVRLDDAGFYTCIVDIQPSTIRKDIHLTVIRLPTIVLSSSSNRHQVSVENKAVQLRCRAEGSPTPQLTWYRQGQQITAGTDGETLTLHNVTRSCEGQYECRAKIPSHPQSASHFINLTVHYMPEIRYVQKLVMLEQQQEALLECDVIMNPVSGIRWLDRSNKEVLQSNRHLVRVDPVSQYRRRTSLRIRQLQYHDFGLYTCEAYNVIGTSRATVRLAELVTSSTSETTPGTKPELSLPSSRRTSIILTSYHSTNVRPTSSKAPTADAVLFSADAVLGSVSLRSCGLLLALNLLMTSPLS